MISKIDSFSMCHAPYDAHDAPPRQYPSALAETWSRLSHIQYVAHFVGGVRAFVIRNFGQIATSNELSLRSR